MFPVDTFRLFSKAVAPYTPVCMKHKLLPEHRNLAGTKLVAEPGLLRKVPVAARVISIKESKKKNRWRTQFDLQINGDSFYLVGGDSRGVVVHNSPEVQPGGMAPGFAASTETKFWSGKYKMDDDSKRTMSVEMNFRVEKNKTAAARMEGSFTLVLAETKTKKLGAVYDEDFLISMGEKIGLVERKGVIWHVLGKEFRKKEDMETALLTDLAFAAEMRKVLMQVLLTP
jgi:hypothetical protein